jgi:hypothetical protein
MERLISLFRQPEEFEFAALEDESYPYPWLENQEDGEPEYFVQLMEYLRERKEKPAREGAD